MVNIDNNAIGDEGIQAIIRHIQKIVSLEQLSIGYFFII